MPEIQEIVDAFDKIEGEIKSFQEKAEAEIKANGEATADTKSALDGLADRLLGLEQKMARRGGGNGAQSEKSIGAQLVESDSFKSFQSKTADKVRFEVKATITSATSDAAGSVGAAIVPHRVPGIVMPVERALTVRDLIANAETTSNAVQYVREKSFNNAAAPVAENPETSKPASDIQFELKDANVRTLAHVFHLSRQAVDDVPQLVSYVNSRGVYGLRYVEETQILNGSGQGQNLFGIMPQATAFDESLASLATGPQYADILRVAILQARQAEYRASAIMLNPADWARIELLKTTGVSSSGEYLWANPRVLATPSLWGLPVVDTAAITEGTFLLGDFANAATVWQRQGVAVEMSEHHGTNFTENLVTIRVEERLALTVTRPDAFIYGQFDLGASPTINQ